MKRADCTQEIRVVEAASSISTIVAIDNTKAPWTSQPDGTCHVRLCADIIAAMECLIARHGDRVGITRHHCGMGQYSEEVVTLHPIFTTPDYAQL